MSSGLPRTGLALIGLLAGALAGCGSSHKTPSRDLRFQTTLEQRCSDILAPVSAAADFDAPGAPDNNLLARAASALGRAADSIDPGQAPDRPSRDAAGHLRTQLTTTARDMSDYVRVDSNAAGGGSDAEPLFEQVSTDLVSLEVAAAGSGAPACSLVIKR